MPDEPDDISIPYMILADAAEAVGGKLYILGGGWDRLMIPAFPGAAVKPFGIALGITTPYSHTNRKFSLTVELLDGDGGQIGGMVQAQLETGRPAGLKAGTPQSVPVAIGTNPTFPAAGRYSFVASIDGEPKNHVAFDVVQLILPGLPGGGVPR